MNSIYEEVLAAIHSVWHRRWLALGVAWAVCLAGWLAVAMIPNSYESHARIFAERDDTLDTVVDLKGKRTRDLERVRQTLTSSVNLEKVVRSTRIGEDATAPKDVEAAVLALAKDVKVVSQQDDLFEITAEAHNPNFSDAENAKLAQDIVQKLIDIFREENLSGSKTTMAESIAFLDQQLAERKKDLEVAEQKRMMFEAQHPELAQGGMGMFQRIEAARSQMRDVEADLAAAQSALASINGQLAGTPQTLPGMGPVGTGGARQALAQAQAELATMRARGMTDNHPDVITLKNQVAQLRQAAAREPAGAAGGMPNPAYSSLLSIKTEREASIQALQSRRGALQADLAQLTSLGVNNPEVAAQAKDIGRDYDVLKQQYDKLLAQREQIALGTTIDAEGTSMKFSVVDPPTTPRSPVAPNRPLLLLGVLFAGLGAGVGVAFLIGQVRNSFATASKLEKALGLPVLGAISTTLTDNGRAKRRKQAKYFVAASAALAGLFVLLMAVEFIQVAMVA